MKTVKPNPTMIESTLTKHEQVLLAPVMHWGHKMTIVMAALGAIMAFGA